MASAAQILANRVNATKSTRPTSDEGKAQSSRNAQKHGLYSRQFVILPGQEAEFDAFIEGFDADLQPANTIETAVFQQIAQAAWTIRRCDLAEVQLHNSSADPTADPLLDDTNEAKLRRIDICRRRAQSAFQRTMKELRTLQTERQFRLETLPEYHDQPEVESIHNMSAAISYHTIHQSIRADEQTNFFAKIANAELLLGEVEAQHSLAAVEQTKPICSSASGDLA